METTRLTRQGTRAGRGWTRVTRGAHRRTAAADPLRADLAAWQSVLPEAARFTHLTGAAVHQLWMPPVPDDLPVWVVLPYGVARPARPGLRVVRSSSLGEPAYVDGLRLEPPARCVQRASRDLHELDLTCLLDGVRHLHHVPVDDLGTLVRERAPGAPRLRRALARSDHRAESIWEVMLRVLHTCCDVEVEPQLEVRTPDGTFVARGDLALVGTTSLHEYDGGDHLTRAQQRADLRRSRRLGATGWQRRGYTSADVLHRATTILRDADRALGRPHEPSRIRPWHDLLKASLFTPAGTELLRRRLRLTTGVGEMVS